MSTLRFASPHMDRDSLLHDAADDMGEYGVQNAENLRAGLLDAKVYALAEQERAKVVRESVCHLLHTEEGFHRHAGCTGDCEGGRDCTCSHSLLWRKPEPELRPARWLGVAVVLVLACIGAGALTRYFGGLT